jgi:hypothetical protein
MSKSYSKASMKMREIELKMNRNLMAVGCDVRTCVLSVYYIDTVYNKDIVVTGTWQKIQYTSLVKSILIYNQLTQNFLSKTVDLQSLEKFQIKTSSDLHR